MGSKLDNSDKIPVTESQLSFYRKPRGVGVLFHGFVFKRSHLSMRWYNISVLRQPEKLWIASKMDITHSDNTTVMEHTSDKICVDKKPTGVGVVFYCMSVSRSGGPLQ